MLPHPHLPLYTSGTFKGSTVIVQSFQNHKIIRGTLTLTVWPEVALAALGELYHQSAKLSAAFQVPLEGQVVQTLLLLALKEEIQPSLHIPSLYLNSWALVCCLVEDPRYCPSRKWASNGQEPCAGNSFLRGIERQMNGAGGRGGVHGQKCLPHFKTKDLGAFRAV